ncbi:MAG: hypothetical protein ABL876_08865 [Chitinophagaceae bacterium]
MTYTANAVATHPKIKALKQKLERTINLAVEKAAGHLQHPEQYPLSSNPKSMERAFYDLIAAAPKRTRNKIIDKANLSLNASTTKRKSLYGDLATVNLKTSTAVLDQVAALPVPEALKMTPQEIEQLTKRPEPKIKAGLKKIVKAAAVPQPQAIAAGTVAFFVDTLTCGKTSELGKDEIILETIVTNGLTEPQTLPPIDLGKFKKGDTKAVSSSPLFNFDIIEDSTGSVQNLTAMLFLREKDVISNVKLARKLAIVIAVIGLALALLAFGIAIVGTLLALTSQALFIVMLVSFFTALGLQPVAFHLIPLLADDVSTLANDSLVIDPTIQVGDVFNRSASFDLLNSEADLTKGKYTAALRWVKTA